MDSANGLFQQGTACLARGELHRGAVLLAHSVQQDPGFAPARHNLALALHLLGDAAAAQQQVRAALTLAPTAQSHILLGTLLLVDGELPGALAELERATVRDPGEGTGWYAWGIALGCAGRWADAVGALERALAEGLPELVGARVAGHLADLRRHPGERLVATRCSAPLVHALLPAAVRSGAVAEARRGVGGSLSAAALAERLRTARCVVALTGAGISAASGLLTRKALWKRWRRDDAVSVWRFQEDPRYLWGVIADFWGEGGHLPNAAHRALARLPVAAVLTQNVDGLHQQAGSQEVVELHGSLLRTCCHRCGQRTPGGVQAYLGGGDLPQCAACGGPIRPDVRLFGEVVLGPDLRRAKQWVERADVLLVVGCAMDVAPASELPRLAAARGAMIVEVKRGPSRLTDALATWHLAGAAEEVLPAVLAHYRGGCAGEEGG